MLDEIWEAGFIREVYRIRCIRGEEWAELPCGSGFCWACCKTAHGSRSIWQTQLPITALSDPQRSDFEADVKHWLRASQSADGEPEKRLDWGQEKIQCLSCAGLRNMYMCTERVPPTLRAQDTRPDSTMEKKAREIATGSPWLPAGRFCDCTGCDGSVHAEDLMSVNSIVRMLQRFSAFAAGILEIYISHGVGTMAISTRRIQI